MNQPSLKLCPRCNKPFLSYFTFNSIFDIYVHKHKNRELGFFPLLDYCMFRKDHVYDNPTQGIMIDSEFTSFLIDTPKNQTK